VWISLALHAAAIALVQVAPPAAVSVGEPAIEARLAPAPAATKTTATEPATGAVAKPVPRLAPSVSVEALPVRPAEPAPRDEPVSATPPAAATQPAPIAAAGPAEPAAAAAPAATITSAVDLTYYSVRELDVQPRALREIVPEYPADADRRRLSGKVRVLLKLEADGRVSDIEIASAMPAGVFEDATLKAFRNARFAPAQKNGRPVRARVLIEVLYDWEGRARNQ
jgi:protein TonB